MKESSLQLIGKPRINSFVYETNKKYKATNEKLNVNIKQDISISKAKNKQLREAAVVLKLGIFTMTDFTTVPFKIELEIEGHFKWDEALDKEKSVLKKMLEENAPAILYTFVRPFITLITFEANMPPLVIPLLNFKKKTE
ncbi:MAG: protein-export chaperone SecB [Acidaminococcaceae bacterium]|nr:protein-export chaperone SecB [Acidaminococcaceae bacterium]